MNETEEYGFNILGVLACLLAVVILAAVALLI